MGRGILAGTVRGSILGVLAGILVTVSAAFCAGPSVAPASQNPFDPSVASAQAVLRERSLYPGEITGVFDRETQAAIRRFQIVRGLRVTGSLDSKTLLALNLREALPQAVMEADRQFLHKLPPLPVAERAPFAEVGEPTAAPTVISPETVKAFLKAWLKAASQEDPLPELTYFADFVDYFDRGQVTHEWLDKELHRTHAQQPREHLDLTGIDAVSPAGRDAVAVRFGVRVGHSDRSSLEVSRGSGRQKGKGRGRREAGEAVQKWEATVVRLPDGGLRLIALRKLSAKGAG